MAYEIEFWESLMLDFLNISSKLHFYWIYYKITKGHRYKIYKHSKNIKSYQMFFVAMQTLRDLPQLKK